MSTVKYDTVIDAMWEQWTKGLQNIADGNKQIEQWTLKALEQQQEFVTKAVEQLQATDKQWKAELEDLQQKQLKTYVKQLETLLPILMRNGQTARMKH